MKLIRFLCAVLFAASSIGMAAAAEKALTTTKVEPYFVTLKDQTTNMREGPGPDYRVKWVYHRKNMPVEVIASYDAWRRVRDRDGEIGWINQALLSRTRSAIIIGEGEAPIYGRENTKSDPIALAMPGAIGMLKSCGPLACNVSFEGASGWVERMRLWGIHDGAQY